ncbi:DNA-binding transcriptional LysR family regulator [Silvimonas terrae]|uniref:DNA-binding transcriptional LysR family regulator n=1 Tax=Silvimonas terrae TaxID=300266 RepID=A0A840RKJ6_9NEIS|nr:LysR family transcriptional regulator [Silvimonas terrae]MBB5193104.1 DNA-binding transcriptional LysR family regulator [Silvimonas terrae]
MIKLTLRELEIFLATARAGGVTAAAEQIGLSQSAASSALGELERRLGVQLFDRVGRRLELNEHGRWLLPQAEAVLAQASEIESRFNTDAPARLRLYASSTIGNRVMPALIARFLQQAPANRIELAIGNTADAVATVAAFEADMGLIEGICDDARILIEPWLRDELVIVAAPDHPLAGVSATPQQLASQRWLLREPGSGTREVLSGALAPLVGSLDVALELGSSEAIKGAVRAGLGLACLSRRTVGGELARGELVAVGAPDLDLTRHFYLIRARDKVPTQGMQRFHAWCMAQLAEESSAAT